MNVGVDSVCLLVDLLTNVVDSIPGWLLPEPRWVSAAGAWRGRPPQNYNGPPLLLWGLGPSAELAIQIIKL